MNKIRVSIIEDDLDLQSIMNNILTNKGFEITTFTYPNDFLTFFKKGNETDLILTDKNLPQKNGLSLTKSIRLLNKDIPIFIITGKPCQESNIETFKVGADDFIKKPFDYDVLIAKMNRALEKKSLKTSQPDLIFFKEKQELALNKNKIPLTPNEALILQLLFDANGELVERSHKSLQKIHSSLDVHLSSLRKKLKNSKIKIKTVHGKGLFLDII